MTVLAIVLVILSALLHAVWNAAVRIEKDKDSAVVIAIAVASVFAGIVAAATAIGQGNPFPNGSANTGLLAVGWTIAAGVLEGFYFWTLAKALSIGPLGTVYTLQRGGAVIIVWPVSIIWLGEPLSGLAVAGSAILLLGLVAAGAEKGASRRAVLWALTSAVFIAAYHLCYKAALANHGEPSAVFAISLSLASVLNLLRLGRAGRERARQVFRIRTLRLIGVGVITSTAFLLFMQALATGGAGAIVTLRNTSVLFATVLAWRIGDRPGWRQIVGACLVGLGAVVLSLGAS